MSDDDVYGLSARKQGGSQPQELSVRKQGSDQPDYFAPTASEDSLELSVRKQGEDPRELHAANPAGDAMGFQTDMAMTGLAAADFVL